MCLVNYVAPSSPTSVTTAVFHHLSTRVMLIPTSSHRGREIPRFGRHVQDDVVANNHTILQRQSS